MKALIFKRYGKPDQIVLADIPRPTPKPNEILVQVHAAGLNPIDNMIPKGTFKPILKFQLPATLGSDLAGVVVEVGSRVTRFRPGDAVFASIFDLGTGALAEFAIVPEDAAALKPPNLDFVRAASIPMVSLVGPPDTAFARARGMNVLMVFVFGWLSRKIIRHAGKIGASYSFLFVHPNGRQLAEIGELLKAERIRPVIDKVFPFEQAKEALAYLEKGRAKGKVVVQMR
jgi:NADPH:quinone reductase-like Zn-dependent oxidoreductase